MRVKKIRKLKLKQLIMEYLKICDEGTIFRVLKYILRAVLHKLS